uniref:Uncharacterized protein n=1 Tax=Rhizophora mucronata TaxID=61149 RepID=A0A2P2N550_RHIMU
MFLQEFLSLNNHNFSALNKQTGQEPTTKRLVSTIIHEKYLNSYEAELLTHHQ